MDEATPLTSRTAAVRLVNDEAVGAAGAADTVGGAAAMAAVESVLSPRRPLPGGDEDAVEVEPEETDE